jgi:hypothetical protein
LSGIFRGSEQEVPERTLAVERQMDVVEAELAALRAHRRMLTGQLAAQGRRSWLPELKGLLFGGAMVVLLPLGLVLFACLMTGLASLWH